MTIEQQNRSTITQFLFKLFVMTSHRFFDYQLIKPVKNPTKINLKIIYKIIHGIKSI